MAGGIEGGIERRELDVLAVVLHPVRHAVAPSPARTSLDDKGEVPVRRLSLDRSAGRYDHGMPARVALALLLLARGPLTGG
jgi:hypothetical protein